METNLYVKFYTSVANKQNMWIEQEGKEGIRYRVNNIEDIKKYFQEYIEKYTNISVLKEN